MSDLQIEPVDVHRDERGWVSEVYSGNQEVDLRNIHLGTMNPGAVRGNHVHDETREWISFLKGPIQVRWGSPSEISERRLQQPSRIYLPPGTPHAFRNPGEETVTFAAYTNRRYDEENPDAETVTLFE